ncbi:MAG: phosphatase PAP2 family protein [Lachnospiraceae bacterium]|nr:phosphatase PAP2 family protein [Lachnospiraceae bacterium]
MKEKKQFLPAAVLLGMFLLWTILVKTVDVAAIGPEDTKVGFSHLNGAVHELFGFSNLWYTLTKISGCFAFLVIAVFALLGLIQMIVRKDIRKVDRPLLALGGLYVVTAVLYVFFEKVVVNYRPVILPGEEHVEASYPSTHTLLAVVVFGSAFLLFGRYVQNETAQAILQIVNVVLLVFTVLGRLLSGAHWLTDIIGGILLGAGLVCAYVPLSKGKRRRKKRINAQKQPMIEGNDRETVEKQPTASEKKPTISEKQPMAPDKKPAISEKQSAIGEKGSNITEIKTVIEKKQSASLEKKSDDPDKPLPVSESPAEND